MTTSFAPSTGEVILHAYRRIGINRTDVDQDKLFDARMELNLLGSDWANQGPNLWTVDQQTIALSVGQVSTPIDPATVNILDAWMTVAGQDRILTSISRSDYVGYPNKAQVGPPTSYWFDRLSAPTVTFWPVPDQAYAFNFFRFRQIADAALPGGQTPDIPYRWIDALIWGLAERLAFIHAPDKLPVIAAKSQQVYTRAAEQDTENAPVTFQPQMSGYYQ